MYLIIIYPNCIIFTITTFLIVIKSVFLICIPFTRFLLKMVSWYLFCLMAHYVYFRFLSSPSSLLLPYSFSLSYDSTFASFLVFFFFLVAINYVLDKFKCTSAYDIIQKTFMKAIRQFHFPFCIVFWQLQVFGIFIEKEGFFMSRVAAEHSESAQNSSLWFGCTSDVFVRLDLGI